MTKTKRRAQSNNLLKKSRWRGNPDIKIIIGIKLKYLSEKINEFGFNHMFQLLDESPFKELVELEDMKTYLGI